jgi:serine/threonine-protein kinase
VGVQPGEVLAGKYRIERILGAGGMGVVVAAHHIQLDEKVALKFLLPEALKNSEAVSRFLREARAAVKIKSEHVVRVSDVGQLDNGSPYMVMEYLEGGDLAAWLKQRGPLPVEQAVEFVLQACVAVAEAHVLGIVHRDLKPANLFCVRRSDGQLCIKVLDFGISKVTNPSGTGPSAAMTSTSALMGTPLYMSPEQMRSSKDVDARTDIWALGAILHELLAGRPAFLAESVTELAIKVASEPAPPVRSFRPDVPAELEAIVLQCLEKRREDRYRDVGELSIALLPFAPKRAKAAVERISGIIQAAGLSASALAMSASTGSEAARTPGGTSPETLPAIGRTTRGASKGKAAAFFGSAIFVALALGGGSLLYSRLQRPDGDQAVTSPTITGPGLPAEAPPRHPPPTASFVTPTDLAESPRSVVANAPVETAAPPVALPPAATTGPWPKAPRVARPRAGSNASTPPAPAAPSAAASSPTVAPAPAPAPNATANCDPPYFFDARGNRTFKPECL